MRVWRGVGPAAVRAAPAAAAAAVRACAGVRLQGRGALYCLLGPYCSPLLVCRAWLLAGARSLEPLEYVHRLRCSCWLFCAQRLLAFHFSPPLSPVPQPCEPQLLQSCPAAAAACAGVSCWPLLAAAARLKCCAAEACCGSKAWPHSSPAAGAASPCALLYIPLGLALCSWAPTPPHLRLRPCCVHTALHCTPHPAPSPATHTQEPPHPALTAATQPGDPG